MYIIIIFGLPDSSLVEYALSICHAPYADIQLSCQLHIFSLQNQRIYSEADFMPVVTTIFCFHNLAMVLFLSLCKWFCTHLAF